MACSKEERYMWYVCLVVAMTMILYGYDSSTFNAVQGSANWKEYFHHPDPNVIGSVNTAYTIGGIVAGFFISAPISDNFGRRWAIAAGCAVVIVSTFVTAFTPRTMGGFIAGRAIVGIGQGIALPAGPTYISEVASAESRGKIMSFWQMNFAVGSFLAYWIAYAATRHSNELGDWDWRIVVIFQLLSPLLIIVLLFSSCPETPRWYVKKDRVEEAMGVLRSVRNGDNLAQQEVREILAAIAFEKESISPGYAALWKDKSIRRRLLLAVLLNVGQQLSGQGSLNNYSTIIYQKVFSSNSEIQLINALNGTLGIFFTLNATWTVDRYGRRWLLLFGAAGMAVCMICVAAMVTETPGGSQGEKSRPVGIATVFLMFLFAFFYKPTWGATVWIWTAEIFSMNVRNQAIAMSAQSQNIANAVLQQVFPLFLAKEGFYAMYMFGGLNAVLFAYVWFFIVETKGVPIEKIDTLFGGADHAEDSGNGPKTMVEEEEVELGNVSSTVASHRK